MFRRGAALRRPLHVWQVPNTVASNPDIAPVVLVDELRLSASGRSLVALERWEIYPGERVAIVGPSGSGKTTFLQTLAGLRSPDAGRVIVDGQELGGMSEARRDVFRGRHIGFVHQTLHLVTALSVLDNLRLAAFVVGKQVPDRRLLDLLASVGLESRALARTIDLSHGEAQRVAIARALVNEPRLVLADEPTSALDDRNARVILELLFKITKERSAALVVATHDGRLIGSFDRRLELGNER